MKSKVPVCFDFDGVIHKYSEGWTGSPKIYDPPMPGIREWMHELVRTGCRIIILTARRHPNFAQSVGMTETEVLSDILNWLDEHGFEQGVHYHEITCMKPPAVVYVDDRAVRFSGTKLTRLTVNMIINREKEDWTYVMPKAQSED